MKVVRDPANASDTPTSGVVPPTRPQLDALVRPATDGDRQALEALLRGLGPVLLRVVRGVVGHHAHNVEDLMQESLMAVARALPAFRGESGIVHYASRIAVRTAVSARRAQANRESLFPSVSADGEPVALPGADSPYAGNVGRSPEAEALSESQREALRAVLAQIPEAQAEALTLRLVLGLSVKEIAETTETPVNTVRNRLAHGKRALRDRFKAHPELRELLERSS